MQLNADVTIKDLLLVARKEKSAVVLHLRSGAEFRGKVGSVTDIQVVIMRLAGREKYDAILKLEDIAGLEVRARA